MGHLDHGTRREALGPRRTPDVEPHRATVLVVDDEPLMRTVMKRVLLDEGFEVLTASTPAEALSIVDEGARPDLVLTDLVMPEMDGVELSLRLREVWPDLPIVFMSGASEQSQVGRLAGRQHGTLLEKPFEIEALVGCVRGALARALAH